MATNVNTKFIVMLTGAALLVGAGGYAAYTMSQKSASDLVAEGEKWVKENNWKKAEEAFSKAVNKARRNDKNVARWIDALEKITPETRALYEEKFRNQYMVALEQYATLLRTDLVAQRRYLDIFMAAGKYEGRNAQSWQGAIDKIEAAMRRFDPGDTKSEELRRYRGLARVEVLSLTSNFKAEDVTSAIEDLNVALKINPADEPAAIALARTFQLRAGPLAAKGDETGSQALQKQAVDVLEKFVSEHPPAAGAVAMLTELRTVRLAREMRLAGDDAARIGTALSGEWRKPFDAIMASDPKKLEPGLVIGVVKFYFGSTTMAGGEKPFENAIAAIEHCMKGGRSLPLLMASRTQIALDARKYETAADYAKQLVAMPDLPVSLDGMMLFRVRDAAQADEARAYLGMAGTFAAQPRDPKDSPEEKARKDALDEENLKKRKEWIAKAVEAKEKFRKRTGGTEPEERMLDARIALMEGRIPDARIALTKYDDETRSNSPDGLRLLSQVLVTERNFGGAKQTLQKMVERRFMNEGDYQLLMRVHAALTEWSAADRIVDQLLLNNPRNPELLAFKTEVSNNLMGGGNDPYKIAERKFQDLFKNPAPDMKVAAAIVQEMLAAAGDRPDRLFFIAQVMARMGDAEGAIAVMENRFLRLTPNDENAKKFVAVLKAPNRLEKQLELIDEAEGTKVQKLLQKAIVCDMALQRERGMKFFNEAAALEPDHPGVLMFQYEMALAERRFTDAEKLVERAGRVNADQMQGRSLKIRFLAASGKHDEAIALAKTMAEGDRNNPVAWRILGEAHMRAFKWVDAKAALQQALALRPSDPASCLMLVDVVRAAGQDAEALRLAREFLKIAGIDPRFQALYLDLEWRVGDREVALETRRRDFKSAPQNIPNTFTFAEWLIQSRLVDEAAGPIKVLAEAKAPNRQILDAAMWMIRGNADEAMKSVNEFINELPKEARNGTAHITAATLLTRLGFPGMNERILEAGRAEQKPDNLVIEKELASFYFQLRDWKKAEEALKRVLASEEDKDWVQTKRLAEVYLNAGRFDEAIAALKPVSDNAKDVWQAHLLRGAAFVGKGDRPRAREAYAAAVKALENAPITHYQYGIFLLSDDASAVEGREELDKALRLEPRFFPARQALAADFARRGENDKMIALMRDGIKVDPANPEARALLINALRQLSRWEEVNALLNQAIDEDKENRLRWRRMASDLFVSQREAERAIEQEAKIWAEIKNPSTARRYAEVLLMAKRPDTLTARQVLDSPEAKTEESWQCLVIRGRVYLFESNTPAAERDYAAALKKVVLDDMADVARFIDDLQVSFGKADTVLTFLGRNVPAGGWSEPMQFQINRIKSINPATREEGMKALDEMGQTAKNPDVRFAANQTMGEGHYNGRDFAKAAVAFKRNVELRPNDTAALNNLAYVLSKYMNNPSEALPMAERAVQLVPNDSSYNDTLGSILLSLKQYERAEAVLKRALGLAPDVFVRTPPLLHLAELRIETGDRRAADDLLREVRRNMPQDPRIEQVHGEELKALEKRAK